jgi:hypothetical protein
VQPFNASRHPSLERTGRRPSQQPPGDATQPDIEAPSPDETIMLPHFIASGSGKFEHDCVNNSRVIVSIM